MMWKKVSQSCHLAAIIGSFVLVPLLIGQVEGEKGVGLWKGVCELVGEEPRVPAERRRRKRSPRPLKGAEQENPEALFKYLFPLVVEEEEEDQEAGGRRGRHMDFDKDLSEWIDDALALVRQECQETLGRKKPKRKKSGRGIRRQGNWPNQETVNTSSMPLTPWNLPKGYNFRWASDADGQSAGKRKGSSEDDDEETHVEDIDDEELLDELANFEDDDDEDYAESQGTSTPSSSDATTEAPTTTAAPTDTTTPVNPGDVHFASYGGDVEYWFPMISWGIPFDGEITVYNFHGFDGMGTF